MEELKFLQPAEFGRRIGRCRRTVLRMCQDGTIPPKYWTIRRKRYYILEAALVEFAPGKVPQFTKADVRLECIKLRERLGILK